MPPSPTPGCLLTVHTHPAEESKKELSAEYVADQKAVDAALLKALTPGRPVDPAIVWQSLLASSA